MYACYPNRVQSITTFAVKIAFVDCQGHFEWNYSSNVPDMVRTSWGEGECALGNSGDEVLLLDATRQVVDVLSYGTGSYPGVSSFIHVDQVYNANSLERWPANRDSNDCGRDFRVRYVPDPGSPVVW